MVNKNNKMVVVLLSLVMIFTLSACVVDADFARKGWDGYVDGEQVWENPNYAEDPEPAEEPEEETTEPAEEEETTEAGEEEEETKASKGEKKSSDIKSTSKSSSQQQQKKPSTGTVTKQQSTQGTTKPSSQGTTKAAEKTMSVAEIVDFYKNAANPVKTMSGVKVTRTREKYIELGGNLSGVSASIVKSAFSEKDDTKAVTYTSQSDIKSKFIVEKQSYVCNLTGNDVKSATIAKSGNNQVVTIYVKDDVDQAQGYSNKAVSSTAVSDLAVPLSLGKLKYMACKDVRLEATIDGNGRLIALHTYMPAYFYSTDESFGVALEQWWTISYS